jgi:uncharacterized protein YndB with AHSA1/START domain
MMGVLVMVDLETGTVRVNHRFGVAAERVFDSWLNPESCTRWLFATPTGQITRCEMEARVGGNFTIVRRDDGDEVEHVGEYRVVERPTKLVFTFAVPKYSAQVTQVTIDITPRENGCELMLLHEHVLPEWASQTEEGWRKILEALDGTLQ